MKLDLVPLSADRYAMYDIVVRAVFEYDETTDTTNNTATLLKGSYEIAQTISPEHPLTGLMIKTDIMISADSYDESEQYYPTTVTKHTDGGGTFTYWVDAGLYQINPDGSVTPQQP